MPLFLSRSSPTSRKMTQQAVEPRHSPVVKSHSRRSVCCSPSGKPWGLRFVASMSCMSCSHSIHASSFTYAASSDVYMDHINRKMAIDMLVSPLVCETLRFQVVNCFLQMIAARRSIGRQFILITPGTKTDITIAPDVRVKELAEPERGQTTLAFQR